MSDIKISELVRSRRRTVELIVTEDARLVVRAPLRTPGGFIDDMIERKRDWIRRKIGEAQSRTAPPARKFRAGETLLYLGRHYETRVDDSPRIYVRFQDGIFLIPLQTLPYASRFMKIWYKNEALRHIRQRCIHFSSIFGYAPKSVRISNAEKRWGSCGPAGTLNFSWRLIMAPPEIIDYLVVHEMAHILYPNHSRSFWEKVGALLPDYQQSRRWLRENGHLLVV